MRIYLLCICFFFGCIFCALAQEANYPAFEKGKKVMYSQKDSAYFYFQKSIVKAKKEEDVEQTLRSYLFLVYTNGYFFDLKNLRKNLQSVDLFMQNNAQFSSYEYRVYYQHYFRLTWGNYYYKLGNYTKAESIFLDLYEDLQAETPAYGAPTHANFVKNTLSYLSYIYANIGKIDLARTYLNKNSMPKEVNGEVKAYYELSLADLALKEGDAKVVEKHSQKALQFYRSHNQAHKYGNNILSSYLLLINSYLKQKKVEKALAVLSTMSTTWKDVKNPGFYYKIEILKAETYSQLHEPSEAMRYYQKALDLLIDYYHSETHPEIAEVYAGMAEVFAVQQKFEQSLTYFQKAFKALSASSNSKTLFPSPKEVSSKLSLLKILKQKQDVLMQIYSIEKKLQFVEKALETGEEIVRTLDALRPEFSSKMDRKILLEETYPAFYTMMNAAFLLYENTGEEKYMAKAFYFSEKSKAVLLLEAVQKTRIVDFANIPDSLLRQERQLLASINYVEKKLFQKPTDTVARKKRFEMKQQLSAYMHGLKKSYPKYYAIKYDTEIVNLSDVQAELSKNTAMLDYYLTDTFLYTFVIGKKETAFIRTPFDSLDSRRVLEVQKLLSHPQVGTLASLQQKSALLYQQLIPALPSSVNTLLIARSDILNYLPFEALFSVKKKAYLLDEYVVSYLNSATLYAECVDKKDTQKQEKILAFAPNFKADKLPKELVRAGLGPLLYNKEEVESIASHFKGEILLGEEASKIAFEEKAKNFSLIHLATHAIIDDQFPDYSYLAFSPTDSTTNKLYIHDLYNYDLQANLVVLSACETGLGDLHKGIGMLSLAKGFKYAGATAMLTTLWKIDDESSAELMDYFYTNLAEGMPKNLALQKAKLTYLKNTDDPLQKHPYYWAGFVLTGNTSPVVEAGISIWWWLLIGVVILGGSFFFVRSRKSK